MLQLFVRYNNAQVNKNILNINFKKNSIKKYNNKYKNLYIYKRGVLFSAAIFSRKSFFRNLLIYANMQYANLNLSVDNNWFYHPKSVLLGLNARHPSFLFKKRFLK